MYSRLLEVSFLCRGLLLIYVLRCWQTAQKDGRNESPKEKKQQQASFYIPGALLRLSNDSPVSTR